MMELSNLNNKLVVSLVAGSVVFYLIKCVWRWMTCPEVFGRNSFKKGRYEPGSYRRKQLDSLRAKSRQFPKPFPNGWYKLCDSQELVTNQVMSFSALGREFVAFRNKKGEVGILNAFCPHLGTNLGHGGVVNEKGSLVCPYHLWEFAPSGKNTGIPYCKKDMSNSSRVNAKGYVTYESKGLQAIFFWFHADQLGKNAQNAHTDIEEAKIVTDVQKKGPIWKLHSGLREVESKILEGKMSHTCTLDWEDDKLMHIFETSQNSADAFHFTTVHQYLPMPFNLRLLRVYHSIETIYGSEIGAQDRSRAQYNINLDKSELIVEESVDSIRWMDLFELPKCFRTLIVTTVHIQGPNNLLIKLETPLGGLRVHFSMFPVEPFRQKCRLKMYTDNSVPWIFAKILMWWIKETIDQDMQVWEHKLHIAPRNVVLGDGPFAQYSSWLDMFYSSKSVDWDMIEPHSQNKMDW